MTRKELINSKEYWTTGIQLEVFRLLEEYRIKNKLTKTELAEKLGYTKSYVSQILNGDFNYTLKKLVELSIVCGKAPIIKFKSLNRIK